ncbi:hypothetical protein RSOLAG22IIIB_01195 [Rhizoctonia solani]|uniref:Uncharacterized protein n=1 Tax=Rhizoctonia solani TaxID=456999 RepID=A0A0K6G5B2_9AGAM|nr:hypothetical protein RSOLAG22IIIB_01195 [Rhizoctonia solani]
MNHSDSDAGVKLDTPAAGMLNTIQVDLVWGKSSGRSKVRKNFSSVQEIGPIYEKTAKKGLSDAAKLGDTINTSKSKSRPFNPDPILNKVVFIFNYAPEGWLRAQGILSSDPTHNQNTQGTLKRERNISPEVVDLDEIDTDDDEIQIIKHMVYSLAYSTSVFID